MTNFGDKIAKEVRKQMLKEKMYDLFVYVALVAMAVGVLIVIVELFI